MYCFSKKNIKNYEDIIVLDDGTEQKYIDKIKEVHPDVKILFSSSANYKYKYIMENLNQWFVDRPNELDPAIFWSKSIQEHAGKYFLLLEDDFWISEPIDLKVYKPALEKNDVVFFRLMNQDFIMDKLDFQVSLDNMFDFLIYSSQIRQLSDVWKIYLVAGNVYRKDYYLYTLAGAPHFCEENYMLQRVISFVQENAKNNQRVRFATLDKKIVYQGWTSSAIGRRDEIEKGFNVFQCNKALNECWYNDELDSMYNYPKDFPNQYILTMFHKFGLEAKQIELWQWWKQKWITAYKNLGINIMKDLE
jgi:hypothetical protein